MVVQKRKIDYGELKHALKEATTGRMPSPDNIKEEYTLKHDFWCSIELAFNEKRGDYDVILRRYPLFTGRCETITAFFHTLEEAKACVERNKKNWTMQGIPFIDENGESHRDGCYA